MANRRGNNGNSVKKKSVKKTAQDFIFLGSKIKAGGYCSHEIKRYLFLGGKTMTNLNSVLKNKHITLLTNVFIVKAMVSPVVMYGYERS